MLHDLRYAFRSLFRQPAFALTAILTLALGIGATTAIFSVVNVMFLRPLPYRDPGQLVRLFEQTQRSTRVAVSYPNFLDWRDRARGFEAMAAYAGGRDTVLGGREATFANVYGVTKDFFRLLGVTPALGRTFVDEEQREGGIPAVVVGYGFWTSTLGGLRDLASLRIVVNGTSARVVGVMPAGFAYPGGADIWAPLERSRDTSGRTAHNYLVIARLRPDVPLAQAALEMNAIAVQMKAEFGRDESARSIATLPLRDVMTAGTSRTVWLLFGAVALVLLVACANVATAMLATGAARRPEMTLRAALGASRARLVRQLFAEALVVGCGGALAGLLVAGWLVRTLPSLAPVSLPFSRVGIDAAVLAFAAGLTVVSSLLFGMIPSLRASRTDLRETLAGAGRGVVTPGRTAAPWILVVGEVAIALVLMVSAGLLIRSFANVIAVDPGFDSGGAITAEMSVPLPKYAEPDRAALFYSTLLDHVRRLPGVTAAGAVTQPPLSGRDHGGGLTFEGRAARAGSADRPYAGYRVATPGYLEALGMRLLQGRLLSDADRPGVPEAAVVNQAFVRQLLAGTDPIGVGFRFNGMDRVNPTFTIVGVIGDVHHEALIAAAEPEVFVSAYQQPYRARFGMTLVVRPTSESHQGRVVSAVREALRALDADVPAEFSTVDRTLAGSVADRRFLMMLLGAFAGVALLLAAVGIYSVLSRGVAQRVPEIGIRIALGADPTRVMRDTLVSAMGSVVAGIALGALGAAAAVRVLGAMLFQVAQFDARSFAGALILLSIVAFVAAYIPARNAARLDPVQALRANQ